MVTRRGASAGPAGYQAVDAQIAGRCRIAQEEARRPVQAGWGGSAETAT